MILVILGAALSLSKGEAKDLVSRKPDSSLTANLIHNLGDRQGVAEAVVFRL